MVKLKNMCDISIKLFTDSSLDAILKHVCSFTDLEPEALKGHCRKRELTEARHAFFILCRTLTNSPIQTIARKLNHNHCSVIHASKNKEIPAIDRIVKSVQSIYIQ